MEDERPGYRLVYATSVLLRNGVRIYAKDYGKRCFRFWVRDKAS